MSILQPEIYIICTTPHQYGIAHGIWIKANQKPSSLHRAVRRLIANSPVPTESGEWKIQATKDFGVVKIGEYDNLETISKIARFIVQEGELGAALINYFSNVDEAKRALQEDYYGAYDSKEEFASQLNDFPDFEELMICYCDYQRYTCSYTRNVFANDFFALEVRGKTHVFDNLANR